MDENNLRLPEPLHSLMNGLERKAVTNFYGAPGTGKTNLCLLASLECIRDGGSVVFIDTEGGFSLDRLRQLTPDVEAALNRITLSEPGDFREQGKVIKDLQGKSPDLVVLDSAVALYRLECAEQEDKGKILMPRANKELSRQLSMLSNLARTKGIPVLITAHTYKNWETGKSEVIGGDSLKYWSKVLVFVEKTDKTSERKAVLTKHRSLCEGRSVKFLITQDGIKPSGFKLF